MVESNQGHEGDRVDPKAGDDKSIHSWRASAEVARFSVEFLSRIPLVDVTDGRIVGSRAMAAHQSLKLANSYTELQDSRVTPRACRAVKARM
jgi:hypothetical protein